MRLLSVLSLILGAGIAISQASATPLRVVVTKVDPGAIIRVGHAPGLFDSNLPVAVAHHQKKPKHSCGRKFRNKAKKVSDWFRVTFRIGTVDSKTLSVKPVHEVQAHGHQHLAHAQTFLQRLTHALMMLKPWEGRAVAFILGCGIGVLIRMFWVLAVVAIRSNRSPRQREEFIEDEVLFEEEEHLLSPPQYTVEHIVTVVEKEQAKEAPRDS